MVEGLYLNQQTVASEQLSGAIIRLYSAVLVYLSKAGKFYSRNTGGDSLPIQFRSIRMADSVLKGVS